MENEDTTSPRLLAFIAILNRQFGADVANCLFGASIVKISSTDSMQSTNYL